MYSFQDGNITTMKRTLLLLNWREIGRVLHLLDAVLRFIWKREYVSKALLSIHSKQIASKIAQFIYALHLCELHLCLSTQSSPMLPITSSIASYAASLFLCATMYWLTIGIAFVTDTFQIYFNTKDFSSPVFYIFKLNECSLYVARCWHEWRC